MYSVQVLLLGRFISHFRKPIFVNRMDRPQIAEADHNAFVEN